MDLLDKMATYVRVVEAGSLSAAAKQLRISPAAVSRQIATLEAELGVPLLLRSTRRMTITPLGQRYYERCLRILRDVDDTQAIGRSAGQDGLLTINAPLTFGLVHVVPRIHELLATHPGLRIDLRLEDRFIDLVLEGVDVAIRVGRAPPESTELVAHRLFAFRRILVAAPRYVKRHGEPRTPQELVQHGALTHEADAHAWALTCGGREVRAQLTVAFRSNALHAVRELAVQGMGVALLPAWFVTEQVQQGALQIILPAWQSRLVAVHALHRTMHRGELRVRALIDHLRGVCAPGTASGPRPSTSRA